MLMHSYRLTFIVALVLFLFASVTFRGHVSADADYGSTSNSPAFFTITVTTSTTKKLLLSEDDYTIAPLGVQDTTGTASVTGDVCFIAPAQETMTLNYADGYQFALALGSSISLVGGRIPSGPDGPHELQLKATGHNMKLLIIRGRKPSEK